LLCGVLRENFSRQQRPKAYAGAGAQLRDLLRRSAVRYSTGFHD
jgi:hypothetical protein